MNTDIVIVAEGSNGGLVGVRDRRTRPQLTYYYTRPLNLQSSHITLKCKGGTISGISYWQGIYGHPDLHITSPDPNHTQWNPVQHMICDTQGDGNPIVGEWIVIEGTFEDYGFQVYGKDVTAKNYVDILGDGVFSYSPENKTLIVRQDYQGFGQDAILYNISAEDLTVNVLDDVALTAQTGIISKKNLTIAGSGRLTLSTDNTTIGMSNGATLTLRDITIDAESKNRCMAGENAECFVVDKAVIRAKGPQGAVCDFGAGIILGDYMIALPVGGYVKNGDIVDSNGKLATEVFISLYGDVNGDGQVGIGDIVAITNVMAGIETDPAVVARADVNADTDVGIGDIVAITNIMSGQ